MGRGRDAIQCRGAAPRAWSLQQKFKGHRPLFMGLLAPDRSCEKVLAIIYLTKPDPALVGEKSRRGRIPFGYEFITNFVLELLGSVPLGCDASDAAGPELGHAKTEKWEGKRAAGRAGPSFQLGFGLLPNRN
jgi:hypothetical protein